MTMQAELEALLRDIGEFVAAAGLGPVDLYLLGGASLLLFEGKSGATKDLDVVAERVRASVPGCAEPLVERFGKSSGRAPYLDPVVAGFPPLAAGWPGRAVPRPSPSASVRLWTLHPADLIVSKLRRWHPRDRADVRHVCDRHPEIREQLAHFGPADFFESDWWEEMEPRRDRVLAYLDGQLGEI
jgi:hypothetical protein